MPTTTMTPLKAYSKHYHYGLGFHGFHRLNYLEWGQMCAGSKRRDTVICVHGVSRNARDFDVLAKHLSAEYRVICPDVVGRGDSDHLADSEGYTYLQYNSDMNALIARLGVTGVDWIGSSMGGIIGMTLASVPQSPIRRLVINDIGPEVSSDTLDFIGDYLGRSGEFNSLEELEQHCRKIYEGFGPMTDEDWQHMVKYSSRRTVTGRYVMKMDPGVGDAYRATTSIFGLDMWETWERISCPVLILRGKESRLFDSETAQKMLSCGPETTLVEFEGVGHTPSLRSKDQIDVITKWLRRA